MPSPNKNIPPILKNIRRSDLAQAILTLNGHPYSLKDYRHMIMPYNDDADELVLHFSRQCVWEGQDIQLSSGKTVKVKDLKIGDYLQSFDEQSYKIVPGRISNIWNNGIKDVYKVTTEFNNVIYVTNNHPIWTTAGWVELKDLNPGDFIGYVGANGSISYVQIIAISLIGQKRTIDIEIEKYHTFIIDQIVTHNTSKSTTLAARIVTDAIMNNYLKQIYVSPTVDQTKIFSNERLRTFIDGSEFINKYFIDPRLTQNVFTKEFKNGSVVFLRYALLDAEKLRGLSGDKLYFDETQSLRQNVIEITLETINRSSYKKVMYSGTPLRSKGTLADIWHRSTMNEYAIKCDYCGHWNVTLDESNIGKHGLICSKCGNPISPKQGTWVSTYSQTQEPRTHGYRVCALHFAEAPWVDWDKDIIHKMETRSKQTFYNEVLALEYDGGSVPITKQELYNLCSQEPLSPKPTKLDASYQSIAGIDFGPENSQNSFTVLVIVQRRANYYLVTYAKKFTGKEAKFSYIHNAVPKIIDPWRVLYVAADNGMGEATNSELRQRLGNDRVVAFQHLNGQKEIIRYNQKNNVYTLNRTNAMTRIFNGLKSGKIRFKKAIDMEPFFEDILNIYAEYDEEIGTMRYMHEGPDDFFHALLYAIFASDLYHQSSLLPHEGNLIE